MKTNLYHELPKIELHCHLDGSVRPSTLLELARAEGLTDCESLEAFQSYICVPQSCESLVAYLECFKIPISIMQTKEQLERVAYELIEDVANENVKYIEVRFAPHFHMKKGLQFGEVIEAVLAGLEKGSKAFGTDFGLILCCMRHLSPEASLQVVKDGHAFLGKGVVGVDLAGDEHHYPPELHKEAFDLAKALGYRITIHAGETGLAENVIKSIELLHAERIGHGLYIKDDKAAYALVMSTETCLEMCPTSNLNTKAVTQMSDHPLPRFLKEGIRATFNTDNRTVSNTNLTHEIALTAPHLDDFEALYRLAYHHALEASFAPEPIKEKLRKLL